MKIIMFRSNQEVSAVIQQNTLGHAKRVRQPVENAFLARGYADRLLWEEAAAVKAKPRQEYIIPGNWQ